MAIHRQPVASRWARHCNPDDGYARSPRQGRPHDDPCTCPDALIVVSARFQEYGPIVHDGGTSSITIDFCPWCGRRLPESQRDRWFAKLERRGIDPWKNEVPAEFHDDSWIASLRQE